MRLGEDRHYRWLRGIISASIILNLLDAVLTLIWLQLGAATEANPFMEQLLSWGPVPFVLGKLGLVSLGSLLLWRLRDRALAVVGIFILFAVYYAILLYHLQAMNIRLVDRIWGA